MRTLVLSLLLASAAVVTVGCEKDVKEVRRTDRDKYAVGVGGWGAESGGPKYDIVAPGTAVRTKTKPGAPSAPRQEPKALRTPARTISGG